ncbi:MAG: RagB/SusD family nutrient uptake outer membrane protein [Prevotella sp.]|jgi:hypothetical protein|nr:RagB/SusD family nutrient uptake outer membrane protein [Prevotella sp.]
MKLNIFKYGLFAVVLSIGLTSCDDFLDRPAEDSYNEENYYQTDAQCIAGVGYLYSSPWHDLLRGYFMIGEMLSGNLYAGQNAYVGFTVNGSDQNLKLASASMWSVIAHANTVYNSIKKAPSSVSDLARNTSMGECLTWKAMAYFYLVRTFGEIPIIHDNASSLAAGNYNSVQKVKISDVYDYIILTLEKARELLPKSNSAGRIDYYCATALLAKVYLTKAGCKGSLDANDMAMAAAYAKEVIDESGRKLMDNYEDVFRLQNNNSSESLIAWRWTANGNVWTAQNYLQCDLGMQGFDEFGDTWGDWTAPSVDLQEAFGIKLLEQQPDAWINNVDTRLRGTMMLPGFYYSYFWQDKGGFSYLDFMFNSDYNGSAPGQLNSPTGSNCVKHLYGDAYDHVAGIGHSAAYMYNSLATHLLRLSDVYLIYAEAMTGTSGTTTNQDAIDAFYAVRHRAIKNYEKPTSLSWSDIWKERRLELAHEGDRWFDYVRVSYYNPEFCIKDLTNQKRNQFWNLSDLYKNYYETGSWTISNQGYDENTSAPNVYMLMKKNADTGKYFFLLPFPTEDVTTNPNMATSVDGIHVDINSTYSYD